MPTQKSFHSSARNPKHRGGFTLIEVLTVIAIIGILVGLLVPAVMFARKSVQQSAMTFEVQTLGNAITQYKTKFGDFPPDGSNAAVLTAHLRKAFPQIAASEIALLTTDTLPGTSLPVVNFTNGSPFGVMDPSEALVLFLGGLSEDPVFPLSGIGGPFFITNTAGVQVTSSVPASARGTIQYNVDRNNPIFDFKQAQLTLTIVSGLTVSNDESTLFTGGTNDILPAYNSGGARVAPYVYFDHRTYSFMTPAGRYFNLYSPNDLGTARPYKSDDLNTTVAVALNADAHYRYQSPDSFQVIGAGLDDVYGGVATLPNGGLSGQFTASPMFYSYPSGQSIDISTGNRAFSRYSENDGPSPQLDNVTTFADGILENALP